MERRGVKQGQGMTDMVGLPSDQGNCDNIVILSVYMWAYVNICQYRPGDRKESGYCYSRRPKQLWPKNYAGKSWAQTYH